MPTPIRHTLQIMNTHILRPMIGPITCEDHLHALGELKKLSSETPLSLFISSPGGTLSLAFSFYDFIVESEFNLTTVGSGQLACASLVIWLAGKQRLLTPHTGILLREINLEANDIGCDISKHSACQSFNNLYNRFVAEIIENRSNDKLKVDEVLALMEKETVWSPKEAIEMELAHGITS